MKRPTEEELTMVINPPESLPKKRSGRRWICVLDPKTLEDFSSDPRARTYEFFTITHPNHTKLTVYINTGKTERGPLPSRYPCFAVRNDPYPQLSLSETRDLWLRSQAAISQSLVISETKKVVNICEDIFEVIFSRKKNIAWKTIPQKNKIK